MHSGEYGSRELSGCHGSEPLHAGHARLDPLASKLLVSHSQRLAQTQAYLARMIANPLFSDCEFIVSIRSQPNFTCRFPAHRFVLSQFVFFEALFSSDFGDSCSTIPAEAESGDAFLQFLRYMYIDDASVTPQTLFPVYQIASQFSVEPLKDFLLGKLMCLKDASVHLRLLEESLAARDFGKFSQTCLSRLASYPKAALRSADFKQLSLATLEILLRGDVLGRAKEEMVYDHVVLWGEANFPADENGRLAAFARLFPLVRFAYIDRVRLATECRGWVGRVPGFDEIHRKSLAKALSLCTLADAHGDPLHDHRLVDEFRQFDFGFGASFLSDPAADPAGQSPAELFLMPRRKMASQDRLSRAVRIHTYRASTRLTCVTVGADVIVTGHIDSLIRVWPVTWSSSHAAEAFSRDGAVDQFPTLEDEPLRVLAGHSNLIVCMALLEGVLASGGRDNMIILWDVAAGTKLWTLSGHSQSVYGLAMSSTAIFSCSRDRSLIRWSLPSPAVAAMPFTEEQPLSPDHKRQRRDVEPSSSFGDCQSLLQRLAAANGQPELSARKELDSSGLGLCIDRNKVYVACGNGQIRAFMNSTLYPVSDFRGHAESVRCVVSCGEVNVTDSDGITAKRKVLASASTAGKVILWDASTGNILRKVDLHAQKVFSIDFSQQNEVLVTASEDYTAAMVALDLRRCISMDGDGAGAGAGTTAADSTMMAAQTVPGLIQRITLHSDWVTGIAVFDDLIVTVGRDQFIHEFDMSGV